VVVAMIVVPKKKEEESDARRRESRPLDWKLIRSAASVAFVAGALVILGGGVTFAGSRPPPQRTARPICAAIQTSGTSELSEANLVNIAARCRQD